MMMAPRGNGWRRSVMVLTTLSLSVGLATVAIRVVFNAAERRAEMHLLVQTVAHIDSTITSLDRRVRNLETRRR